MLMKGRVYFSLCNASVYLQTRNLVIQQTWVKSGSEPGARKQALRRHPAEGWNNRNHRRHINASYDDKTFICSENLSHKTIRFDSGSLDKKRGKTRCDSAGCGQPQTLGPLPFPFRHYTGTSGKRPYLYRAKRNSGGSLNRVRRHF
jgi:hypothetical protein